MQKGTPGMSSKGALYWHGSTLTLSRHPLTGANRRYLCAGAFRTAAAEGCRLPAPGCAFSQRHILSLGRVTAASVSVNAFDRPILACRRPKVKQKERNSQKGGTGGTGAGLLRPAAGVPHYSARTTAGIIRRAPSRRQRNLQHAHAHDGGHGRQLGGHGLEIAAAGDVQHRVGGVFSALVDHVFDV